MHRQVFSSLVASMAAVLVVAGCTGGKEPAPTADPSNRTASASPTVAGPEGVTKSVALGGAEMTVVVGPVRIDEEQGVIPLEISVSEDSPSDFSYTPHFNFSSETTPNLGYVRALDLEAGVVLVPAFDDGGYPVGTPDATKLSSGESADLEVLIPAPDGDQVDVLLPNFGLVRDVPVVEGEVPAPSEFRVDGEVTFAKPHLESYVKAYDASSSARAEGESATVTLGSDVLFATDEFALTAGAAQVVDQAAAQMAAAGAGGQVMVVGHTDDQASDDYNLDLSRKRAASVAERLTGALGSQFTLAVDGKGESEPVAEGTSSEARAANRRVEIRFTVTSQEALLGAGGTPAPETAGPVGSGHDAVEFAVSDAVSTARMLSVRRVEGYLVGELEITRISGGGSQVLELLSAPGQYGLERGISPSLALSGATDVTLLGPAGRVYPADYVVPGQRLRREIMGDSRLAEARLDDGETMLVTVVWPDIGGDTVDVDVVERFRITDVPVEG